MIIRFFIAFFFGVSLILVTLLWGSFFAVFGVIKIIFPFKIVYKKMGAPLHLFADLWSWGIVKVIDIFSGIEWDIRNSAKLDRNSWFLIISNHQSWNDILVLMKVFHFKIPYYRFFIKRELLYFPIMGFFWWVLDYPTMRRYSKEKLAKNPELAVKDKAETVKQAKRYHSYPVSIVNFLEGSRFTPAKKDRQQSPFNNLLKPKAGGISLMLSLMQDKIKKVLNVTIVYQEKERGFLDLLTRKFKKIVIQIEEITPDSSWFGDYENNLEFRESFQNKINILWQEKDILIEKISKK